MKARLGRAILTIAKLPSVYNALFEARHDPLKSLVEISNTPVLVELATLEAPGSVWREAVSHLERLGGRPAGPLTYEITLKGFMEHWDPAGLRGLTWRMADHVSAATMRALAEYMITAGEGLRRLASRLTGLPEWKIAYAVPVFQPIPDEPVDTILLVKPRDLTNEEFNELSEKYLFNPMDDTFVVDASDPEVQEELIRIAREAAEAAGKFLP